MVVKMCERVYRVHNQKKISYSKNERKDLCLVINRVELSGFFFFLFRC